MTIYEAVNSESETVHPDNAAGRIAGAFIYAYPPDIPIIVPGELITEEVISNISDMIRCGIVIKGMDNDRIRVLLRHK